MTRLFVFILCLLPITASAKEPVHLAGIDYGLVHMVGTEDFNDPSAIFPGFLDTWNALLREEQLDNLEDRLKRPIVDELEHLSALHAKASADEQIVRDNLRKASDAYLNPTDIAKRVASYQLAERSGLGLVFVADQLNKPEVQGCYWVTFFDRATLKVKSTEHRCGKARGFGFRNYWFGTIKNVIADLNRKDVPKE